MDGDQIRPTFGERFQEDLWARAHQMHVKLKSGQRTEPPDHLGAERNVRDEVAVHDVEVKPVRPGPGGTLGLLGILGGLLIARVLIAIFDAAGAGFPPTALIMQLRTVLVSVAVGVGITLASVLIPSV